LGWLIVCRKKSRQDDHATPLDFGGTKPFGPRFFSDQRTPGDPRAQALISVAPALVIAFRGFLFLVRAEDAEAILR
jgi:hypothetical protein